MCQGQVLIILKLIGSRKFSIGLQYLYIFIVGQWDFSGRNNDFLGLSGQQIALWFLILM